MNDTKMISRILKWGNSLSVRIPKVYLRELNLIKDSLIEIKTEENKIIIIPISPNEYNLEKLVSQINENNIHGEIETEAPRGNETW